MSDEASMANPVELLDKVIRRVQEVVDEVAQPRAADPTPCSEWDVRDLLNHLIGVLEFTSGSIVGSPLDIRPSEADSSRVGEPDVAVLAQAYREEAARLLELCREPGALERIAATPFGDMPMGQFLTGTLTDQFIHGWDLAKATGQDTTLDAGVTEFSYGMLTSGFADLGREAGFIGPEIAVSDDASLQDRLIAYMGRQP